MMSRLIAAFLSCFVTLAIAGSPPQRGLLIGANTPIWIASRPDPAGPVNYTRYENGIIEEAIQEYSFLRVNSRGRRDIDDYESIENEDFEEALQERKTSKYKRWAVSFNQVVEYSFLVVMDYHKKAWPTRESHQKEEIRRKIVYALAFYNALNIQLRHARNPRIRLRIGGIIIASQKQATPYLRSSETSKGMDISKATVDASEYWKNLSKQNEFHYSKWHFLGIMTDSNPEIEPIRYWNLGRIHYGKDIADKRLFLFNDDAAFHAMPVGGWQKMEPIAEVIQEFGESTVPRGSYASHGHLVNADFLPGDIIPIYMQCEKRGWEEGAKPCESRDYPCVQLRCANDHWYSKCGDSGPHLVGTVCSDDKKKICLDGQCLDKPEEYVG